MVLSYSNILAQENVSDVWSDCIPFGRMLCAHAYVCVIILTRLFIGLCRVSTIITPYIQCVLHTGLCIFCLYDEHIPCQNHM